MRQYATYQSLVDDCIGVVTEMFPWDISELMDKGEGPDIFLDIREDSEFSAMHIRDSLHVPRGILEAACEFNYEETEPELATGRDKFILLICRSGNRSLLAGHTMQQLGFKNVVSLKTGLRGWNDFELPLVDENNQIVNIDAADEFFTTRLRADQQATR